MPDWLGMGIADRRGATAGRPADRGNKALIQRRWEIAKSKRQAEMIPAQSRAARGLLDWTPQKLADAAGVAVSTVTSFERSWRCNYPDKIQAMQSALEAAGVEFIDGDEPGVKLKAKSKRK